MRDIETALRRSKSDITMDDVRGWMADQRVIVWLGTHLSASAIFHRGKMEVLHCTGKWNEAEAREMWDSFAEAAKRFNLPIHVKGRAGWGRFLKMKGFAL